MNQYSIYGIKEEFAHFFYFRSDVLYRFLKHYEQCDEHSVSAQQFDFITMELPRASVLSHLNTYLPSYIYSNKDNKTLEICDDRHSIALHIGKKRIDFWGDIVHAAEELLFPALRHLHPYFFVAGKRIYNFGWITPVTLGENQDKLEQVLYSYF